MYIFLCSSLVLKSEVAYSNIHLEAPHRAPTFEKSPNLIWLLSPTGKGWITKAYPTVAGVFMDSSAGGMYRMAGLASSHNLGESRYFDPLF